ncbi:LacI family transcriptional regulator [Melghirimyces profundicolus]|uniref:LacI family transcriptional regulator n=1 Tax=Melghirimyces profundicolus TaxID=1242148 RepID=A0A2T6C9L0_9BACL|nr:LacI family DNA-binding transcriptional regulator [Melghirimyces profundicolus]PTX65009.1 LacI family transcriptional regulator [Melghirimyces profundicolus]
MATIKDVAKIARVSPSTVSRVIAGSDRISQKTKERVRKAMEEVNYVPNAIARSLARSRTRTVGFTLSRRADQAFSNPFFSEVLRGMSSVAQMRDYNILLSISLNEEEEKEKCLRLIRERRVDGLIVSTSRVKDSLIDALLREEIPFVVIGRSADSPVMSVNNDNVQASFQATKHLLKEGYREIAFISGPRELMVSVDRLQGYKQALFEAGIPVEEGRIAETDFSEEGGFQALCAMRESGVAFDAVLASDDLFALGALRFATHYRMDVPEELGILGFNDTPMMSHTHPPLTSVRILSYELGAEAMELLLGGLENPEKWKNQKEIVLPSRLEIRESTRRKGAENEKSHN